MKARRARHAQVDAEQAAIVEKHRPEFEVMRGFVEAVGKELEDGATWTMETIHEGMGGPYPVGLYRLVNQEDTISLERLELLFTWGDYDSRLHIVGVYSHVAWPEERQFGTFFPPDGPRGPSITVRASGTTRHAASHIRRRALPQYRARMAWIEEWIRDRAVWWTGIDAMAGKLFREAEGLPGLELRSTEKAAQGIVVHIEDRVFRMDVEEPTVIRVELRSTPALALTILDAVRAYAKLNGLLVCHTCGHPRHLPLVCTELLEDSGSLCSCAANVAEFDVIEGLMR